MLQFAPVAAQLPASDYERAKKFYRDTLGFDLTDEIEGGARFDAGEGTSFWVYPSAFAGTNKATAMGFEVEDLEKTIDDLAGRGVTFQQFDLPYGKTDKRGIAEFGGWRGAWFSDTEGNIIAVGQRV